MDERLNNAIHRAKSLRATNAGNLQQTAKNTGSVQHDNGRNAPQKQQEVLHSLFAELSRNYDREEYIAPPERVGIFVRGFINIIAGKSGVGKSWQIIRWMRDLSRGGDIFGGVVHNEPQRKCLLITGELPKREIERRCRLLEKGDNIIRDYNNFIIIDQKESEAKGITFMLDTKEGQRNIEALIDYHKPDIIIFDSFISLFEGDEAKSTDVKPVMAFLERTAEEYHTAPTLAHHIRKRHSKEQLLPIAQDDIIGSSAFLRKSGFLFAVEPTPDDPKTLLTKEIKSWLKPIQPFTYKVTEGFYGGVRMEINPNAEDKRDSLTGKKKEEQESQAETQRREILIILKARKNATIQEIREFLGVCENDEKEINNLKMQLSRMVKNGDIIRPKGKRGFYSLKEEDNNTPHIDEEPSIDFENEDSE